jgi:hypothetical protein
VATSRLRIAAGACALALWFAGCNSAPAHDLSIQQLSVAVDAQRPSLKHCYDEALKATPYKNDMRVEAVLHIAPSGKVASVEFESGKGLPGMEKCLRDEIKRWQFPTAKDPTATSLPLIFHPEIQKAGPDLDTLKKLMQQVGATPK